MLLISRSQHASSDTSVGVAGTGQILGSLQSQDVLCSGNSPQDVQQSKLLSLVPKVQTTLQFSQTTFKPQDVQPGRKS